MISVIALMLGVALRDHYRRPKYYDDRRRGASHIARPYAIVEAYSPTGAKVLPTVVYSQEDAEIAEQRYLALGCSTTVRTPIELVH